MHPADHHEQLIHELTVLRQRVAQLEEFINQGLRPHEQFSESESCSKHFSDQLSQSEVESSTAEVLTAIAPTPAKSEPQLTEQQLRRYQVLSEYSRDIVLYISVDGRILEANQAAVKAYQYNHGELLTLTIADLRDPETHGALTQQLQQASHHGILFETVHRRKDGSLFPVEVSAQSTQVGQETFILSVIRDITERKQAEQEREQLLMREHRARTAAETAAHRARFLAEVSTVLSSSLDYESTLKSVARLVVPTLADWCVIDIMNSEGNLERLEAAHVDPEKVKWATELYRRYPPNLDASQGIAQVLRTGKSEYYSEVSDDQIVAVAQDEEHLKILREVGFRSAMIVPLKTREHILGVLSFVATAESGRSYSRDDLLLAEEMARQAAIALENAQLYREAQEAQQDAEEAADRTARLQIVTAALSEPLTAYQIAEVIAEQSLAALAADSALIALLTDDETELEIIHTIGYEKKLVEAWRRFPVTTAVPLADAVRAGEPVWPEPLSEWIRRYPHLAEAYQHYDYEGWVSLPLIAEGKALGGLSLTFKIYRDLSQGDREFMLALTQQCAQAIMRAKLYEAERQARAEAERANRVKDEFLAVLSHELRSPLNPILGWAKLLRTRRLDPQKTEQALETIERNAKLQAQLVEDLLDISRILQGKLRLTIASVYLEPVIEAAIETVRLAAAAKSIQIETLFEAEGLTIVGDANRLQQVVWNLLSNAVKFTPTGGHVQVRLQQVEGQAQIQVVDNGQGIRQDFLPYVFDYFRQADSSTTRTFGGLGLGLAIVRQVVELHGGQVEAKSAGEGLGATFTVWLPMTITPETSVEPPGSQEFIDLQGVRILVVDDEADMRDLASFVLSQRGAQVTTAASAMQALTIMAQTLPDVLLCDIAMPDMDGYALVRQLRRWPPERGGRIPAIALTAYAGEYDQQQALAAGFQRHVSKPVEPETLVRVVAQVVQHSPL